MPIATYLRQRLAGQLATRGLTDQQIAPVVDDVRGRLTSLLSHWDDLPIRQALLFIGREEATFYEPSGTDLNVRSLVVMAIRNSFVENLASTPEAARQMGVAGPVLLDRDIPTITGEAIRFFSDVDLADAARASAGVAGRADGFSCLPAAYPAAWRALTELSSLQGAESHYPAVPTKCPCVTVGRSLPTSWQAGESRSQVLSGMERAIEPPLQRVLRLIKNGVVPALFADSFKMITRHPGKLLEVIEFVLSSDRAVVTHNYYLTNGHVAQRIPLLRPAHTVREARDKFHDRSGLSPCHDRALREIAAYL